MKDFNPYQNLTPESLQATQDKIILKPVPIEETKHKELVIATDHPPYIFQIINKGPKVKDPNLKINSYVIPIGSIIEGMSISNNDFAICKETDILAVLLPPTSGEGRVIKDHASPSYRQEDV